MSADSLALLDCPFCGGAAEMREWDWPYIRFQCRCTSCKTAASSRFNTKDKAIAAWNQRAPNAALRERLMRGLGQ